MDTATQLLNRIESAFAMVPRPTTDSITPHRCPECDEIRDRLCKAPVKELSIEELRNCVWDLPLLSAEAKQYFLQAWLCAAVVDPSGNFSDAARIDIDSNLRFDPPGGYTDEQWMVIMEWLDFIAGTGDVVTKDSAQAAKAALLARR
jgi:hypothetical protein